MSVLPQTLLALVSSHLVSLSFFTAWHKGLLLGVRFYLVYERFCRLESWNIMSWDDNGSIF